VREARETLYIRFPALVPQRDTVVDYAFVSIDGPRQPLARQAPLERVLEQASGRSLVIIVPGSEVRLASVTVPARQPAKVLLAAPYQLEESLAEDVDQLHFAIGPRRADGSTPVAVVALERMQQWAAVLQEFGLRADALYSELLCLPWDEALPRWSALFEGGHLVVRTGLYSGFCCEREDLPLLLETLDPRRETPLRLVVAGDAGVDFTQLGWPVELLPGHRNPLEALIHSLDRSTAINLLQGAYSPRQNYSALWRPWKLPIVLAASWLVLLAAAYTLETLRMNRELSALEADNAARYQSLFPDDARIVDLSTQLDRQMSALRGHGSESGLFSLLETVTTAMQENPGFQLKELQFRDGALFLSLGAAELQLLEQLRDWFSRHPQTQLEVQSADSGADGVSIRLKLSAS
jgi:general secretion pathway protein L